MTRPLIITQFLIIFLPIFSKSQYYEFNFPDFRYNTSGKIICCTNHIYKSDSDAIRQILSMKSSNSFNQKASSLQVNNLHLTDKNSSNFLFSPEIKLKEINIQEIIIGKSKSNAPLLINHLNSEDFYIQRNNIPRYRFQNTTVRNMYISNNINLKNLQIISSKIKKLIIQDSSYPIDESNNFFYIQSSQIDQFDFFRGENYSYSSFLFAKDTIGSFLMSGYYNTTPPDSSNFIGHDILFTSCFIYNTIVSNVNPKPRVISFSYCSFGANTYLDLSADTIRIFACINIPHKVSLRLNPGNEKKVYLLIEDSNIKNLIFDYTENIQLLLPRKATKDEIFSFYESFLLKFKEEGKALSYERLDIEYKKYKYFNNYSVPVIGYILNVIESLWWDYGYKKQKVFYWILYFLSIFYGANFIFWNKVKQSYPIIPEKDYSFYEKTKTKKQILYDKLLKVFIFTIFIFFTLKIEFSKLNFKSNTMVAWFFIQYIAGLSCLFFVLNSIIN
jgi:hypothetical protein